MNYHSSQVAAEASLGQHCSDSGISDTLNGTITANDCLDSESKMESLTPPLSSAMSAHSSVKGTPQAIRKWLTCLPQGSPANHLARQGEEKQQTTKEICGQPQQTLFALSSHDAFCLKMCREYAHTCQWSSETCGDLVTPFDDPCSLGLTIAARRTKENGSGLWLTPRAVEIIETPENFRKRMNGKRKNDRKNGMSCLSMQLGGRWNPDWAEWLMGWPMTWTELAPLGMDKYQQWLQRHTGF